MAQHLAVLDWLVISVYLVFLVLFSLYLSRSQHSREDYYVGNHSISPWSIAISTMATQCSTNSILGAPAFVAFAAGGGLVWLQYEMAVPLAMIFIMVFMLPVFLKLQLISVYEYLEQRFDLKTRLILSGLFQFVRVFATAVTVYSVSLVVEWISGLPFFWSVLTLGLITLVYDVLGGIRAVIYSDVIQMGVLVLMLILILSLLLLDSGGLQPLLETLPVDRRQTLDFASHGLWDGETFAFWPMLFGGLFLYVSYYGCDQSQVQRELCSHTVEDGRKALLINGLFRFPVVLLYCLIGVGLAAYAFNNPEFLSALPASEGEPNYNLAVPLLMHQMLPAGLLGLAMVALFAAAMSSLDSVLNSLSATTMEDFVRRFHKGEWTSTRELWISRLLTLFWGCLALCFAFFVGDIADTVLESINIIGSLINGPVLGVFVLGLLTRRANGNGAVTGLLAGFALNLYCWIAVPLLSWLWWNVFGFVATFVIGYLFSLLTNTMASSSDFRWTAMRHEFPLGKGAAWKLILLLAWTLVILLVAVLLV